MPRPIFNDIMTRRILLRVLVGASAATLGASCKESSTPPQIGPPSQIVILPGAALAAAANTNLPASIQLSVQDANGRPVPNQTVTFAVTAGGGSLGATTATSDANGVVTLPTWKLGKSAVPQRVTATLGSITKDISATVTTFFNITIRFFGTPMTPAQEALFTNAAARISGFVTGDIIDADARGGTVDVNASCGTTGQPPLDEIIDDLIIYASIRDIDGPGKILAQAGPCLGRSGGTLNAFMTAVGTMQFDAADISSLTGSGSLQEVITHEMLHVLGYGTLWDDAPTRQLLTGKDTPDPRFTGTQARQGCVGVSGTVTCATSVPVEGSGGAGTANSHWRESSFDTELMTGFIDASPNPLSSVTIGSMADIGYVVNSADFDSYAIPGGLLRAGNAAIGHRTDWERPLQIPTLLILENGKVRPWRK